MAVFLSPVGGVAAQFFTSTGAVLTGGKLFTYAAGTTTPQATYTTSQGNVAWTNPIVLDAAGRVPGSGEIWLTDGALYKFVLKDANDVLIATYDNISGINSNFVAFVNQQEIVTATAGQTVFNLGISYQPGTNSLSVFVDGVNQYGPGAQYSYVETDSTTVTFNTGLHVGAEVKFTTTQQQGAGIALASQVSYEPPFTGALATNVEAKLAQTVSVMDFGAVGNGVADDTAAVQAALTASQSVLFPPNYEFKITDYVTVPDDRYVRIEGTINFYNRRAGFAVVNANNVEIEGTRGSRIYDSVVEANYTFNDPLLGAFAPIVHIRANGAGNKQNFRVHGLRVDHVSVGVFVSVADVNNWLTGGLNLSGADFSVACYDVKASDNYFTYVEGVSLAANFAYRTTFDNNYVYRSGDGGIYFINVAQGAITDNVRESPYGNGTSATNLNDGQGISIETSSDIIISRNRIIAFQDHGIDVKNRCSRINVTDNLLVDCQFSSINSRLGDPGSGSGTGDVNYIYITNNEIKNNGFVHTTAFGSMAAIQVDSFYAAVVENNKINGLRDCFGIRVTGPGNELVSVFSASPRQSVAIIRNNSILWHAYNYDFSPQFNLDATVKDGIYAEGGYLTKLVVEGNTVFANRYSNADPLSNSAYGIKVDVDTDTNINNHYGWPNSLSVKNNSVYGWLGGGMLITTDFNSVQIAANIEGNKIEYVRAQGLYVYRINGATISNNYVVRADPVGLSIDECKNFIATANQAILSDVAANAGADNQDYGLSVTNSENGLVSYNRFSGNVSATNTSGNTNVTLANNL